MTCSDGYTAVVAGKACFGFENALYTCCPPPPPWPPLPPLSPGGTVASPTVTLSNGVVMPTILLGTGGSTWMNVETTERMVTTGLLAGFVGVDTANHYRVHGGVRRGIRVAREQGFEGDVWLQTKMEGCGNSLDSQSRIADGSCYEDTLNVFEHSLRELGLSTIDSVLLHSPPCVVGASWVDACFGPGDVYPDRCDCERPEPCRMMRQQWRALEEVYHLGKARAIGVSNYCSACLECLATREECAPGEPDAEYCVTPHINQLMLHAGMAGMPDPGGLVSHAARGGTHTQAYRPLAQGAGVTALLADPTVGEIAAAHGKSAAQVALRYVAQLGHGLTTTSENVHHMEADLRIFDFRLTPGEMARLDALDNVPGEPSIMCTQSTAPFQMKAAGAPPNRTI